LLFYQLSNLFDSSKSAFQTQSIRKRILEHLKKRENTHNVHPRTSFEVRVQYPFLLFPIVSERESGDNVSNTEKRFFSARRFIQKPSFSKRDLHCDMSKYFCMKLKRINVRRSERLTLSLNPA
jgi:hypothetical protein